MSNNFRPKKRSPFGEVSCDPTNRDNVDQPTYHELCSAFARDPTAGHRKRHQLEPPPSVICAKVSAPLRSAKNRSNNNNSNNPDDSETRARLYKAEAYEAKIRNATQEQRINALEKELDELRFFAAVEQRHGGGADLPPSKCEEKVDDKQQKTIADKDAELIECLAREVEEIEKDLREAERQLKEERSKNQSLNNEVEVHSKLLLGNLQRQLDAEKSRNEFLRQEISLLVNSVEKSDVLWQAKETELKRTIERQQTELSKSKTDSAEVATNLRDIQGEIIRLQQELDDAKSKNQSLKHVSVNNLSAEKEQWQKRETDLKKKIERQQLELSKWKKDTADGVTIMRELQGALLKAKSDNACLRKEVELNNDATKSLIRVDQLENELKSIQRERDEVLVELLSLREERDRLSEQARVDAAKYERLEKSNEELLGVFYTTQSQLENKIEILTQDLSEATEREDKLKEDCRVSADRYEKKKKETDEMKFALDDLANSFEKQKIELELRSSALEELEEVHMASLAQHAKELKASEAHAQTQMKSFSALQLKYQSQMLTFQSQIESLKSSFAMNKSDAACPDDEVRAEINEKLNRFDADGKRCLEREVSSLRARVSGAEGTESRLRNQILLLSEELSETDAAHKENISNLQQELSDVKIALGLRTHSRLPHQNNFDDLASGEELEIIRQQIENDALKDYISQRQLRASEP